MSRILSTLPEGQGVAEGASVARSDQEGAVLSPRLGAVLVDQPLGHLPSLSHLTVKPRLRTVQVLVLDGHGGHQQNIHTYPTHLWSLLDKFKCKSKFLRLCRSSSSTIMTAAATTTAWIELFFLKAT